MYSSPNISPLSSTKTNLSTSGSTAIPKFDLFFLTISQSSVKFSFNGSGLCVKIPFGVQLIFFTSTFNFSNNIGTAIPPEELIPSTTPLKLQCFIAETFIIGRFKISVI